MLGARRGTGVVCTPHTLQWRVIALHDAASETRSPRRAVAKARGKP